MVARCISSPCIVARAAWKRSRPFATYGAKSIPIERMFRCSCAADSSNAKNRQRSPRPQALAANWDARLVLPVPAVPERSTLVPR